MYQLSKEIRRDPGQTGKLRNDFAKSIIRVFKYRAADPGELYIRLSRVLDKYLRQGYLAGQIYAAVSLKRYQVPFKPTVDEDARQELNNIIAKAKITLEQLLDGSYNPEASMLTVVTTRLMYTFNQGVADFGRQHGITTFQYLTAAGCSDECDIENGVIYTLDNILVGICPPLHEGCLCVIVPIKSY